MNSSYGNYLHAVNLSRFKNNRCYSNMRRMARRVEPTEISKLNNNPTKFKEFLNKKNNLSRIENNILNSWCGGNFKTSSSKGTSSNSKVNTSNKNSSTNSTDNKEKVVDTNKLNITKGRTFSVNFAEDKKVTFVCNNNQVYMSENTGKLNSSDMREVGKIEQVLTSLINDASADYVKSNFSNNDIKDVLSKAGIKPGRFTLNSANSSNVFYMLDSGKIYSNYEVQAQRNFYNNTNFIKSFGYSKNAVCKIDGKTYEIGRDGSFNIPSGVLCVPENMVIKK